MGARGSNPSIFVNGRNTHKYLWCSTLCDWNKLEAFGLCVLRDVVLPNKDVDPDPESPVEGRPESQEI